MVDPFQSKFLWTTEAFRKIPHTLISKVVWSISAKVLGVAQQLYPASFILKAVIFVSCIMNSKHQPGIRNIHVVSQSEGIIWLTKLLAKNKSGPRDVLTYSIYCLASALHVFSHPKRPCWPTRYREIFILSQYVSASRMHGLCILHATGKSCFEGAEVPSPTPMQAYMMVFS